jgi:hypothetical protein
MEVFQPQDVADFVHDHRQQVHPASRRAAGGVTDAVAVGQEELDVIGRRWIDEPAETARIDVEEDAMAVGIAKDRQPARRSVGQGSDRDIDVSRRHGRTPRRPAGNRLGDDGGKRR